MHLHDDIGGLSMARVNWGYLVLTLFAAFAGAAIFFGLAAFLAPLLLGPTLQSPSGAPPAKLAATFQLDATPKGMTGLIAPGETRIEPVLDAGSGSPLVRLSGVQSNASPAAQPGIYVRLPEDFENEASGRKVRISVVARRAPGGTNKTFAVSYSTSEVGNSGWQKFTLTDQLSRYSFVYDVPQKVKGEGDFIGFMPDADGTNGAIEIAQILAEVAMPGEDFPELVTPVPVVSAPAPVASAAGAGASVASAVPSAAVQVPGAAPAAVRTASEEAPASLSAKPGHTIVPATFYDIDIEKVRLPADGKRGALAKLGKGLVIATHDAKIYFLPELGKPSSDSVVLLKSQPPFTLNSPKLEHFVDMTLSVLGVGAEPSMTVKGDAWDLYVSMIEFDDERECLGIGMWHAGISLHADAEPSFDSDWQNIFRSTPCLPLSDPPFKHEASLFEAGGRIAFDKDGILLTLGLGTPVPTVDGKRRDPATDSYTQSDAYDYGKVIRIDRTTHAVTHISKGHRNPQGLYVDDDGTIFETEQGPQGGDEINIITPGGNYGWPVVTFGTQYGKKAWNFEEPADKSGYKQPLFSFVPSIGITELIRLKGDQFPRWKGDLMATSLTGGSTGTTHGLSLFRIHYSEGRVIFVEPILIGERMRDLVEADDGRLAVLADGRTLLIISDAAKGNGEAPVPQAASAAPTPASAGAVEPTGTADEPTGNSDAGRQVFQDKCSSCHGLQAGNPNAIAPALGCVAGNSIASTDSFAYSAGLRAKSSELWTTGNLASYIQDPASWAPGARMAPPQVSEQGITDVVAFLEENAKTCH